jgi:hypothetical protein
LGEPVGDAVLSADPVEQHLAALAESVGELFAVVGEDLLRYPVVGHRFREGGADRTAGSPRYDLGGNGEAGAVVHAGDHLRLHPTGQHDAADDVHLPQLHGFLTLPALVVLALAAALGGFDKPVPGQDPIDGHSGRDPAGAAVAAQLELDPAGTPARMCPAQLAHRGLHLGRCLVCARVRSTGPVFQPGRALFGVPADPAMHALPRHAQLMSNLADPVPGLDRQRGPVPLFQL